MKIIGRNRNIPGSHIRRLCNNARSGQGTLTKMENTNGSALLNYQITQISSAETT